MSHVERPHFRFPFTRGSDGRVEVVEQDDEAHIMSCEHVIVRCPVGFREDRPEFGWPFPTFANVPIDLEPLKRALAEFEPRGRADAREYANAAEAAVRHIEVDVEIDA